jgi:hypothetical protein
MWEQLHIVGNDHWIQDSIQAEECIAVTDGSYMKDLYPNLNSAAFIFGMFQGERETNRVPSRKDSGGG